MNQAKDYDLIIQLFEKYLSHKTTKTTTMLGFKKYLLSGQGFPSWLVKNLMGQIKYDPNLAFHVNTFLEHYLVEGMLLGTVKDTAAKLILKNKFGYSENPTPEVEDKGKTARTIKLIPAVKVAEIAESSHE